MCVCTRAHACECVSLQLVWEKVTDTNTWLYFYQKTKTCCYITTVQLLKSIKLILIPSYYAIYRSYLIAINCPNNVFHRKKMYYSKIQSRIMSLLESSLTQNNSSVCLCLSSPWHLKEYRFCSMSLHMGLCHVSSRLDSRYIFLTRMSHMLCFSHCIFSDSMQFPFVQFLVMLTSIIWLRCQQWDRG